MMNQDNSYDIPANPPVYFSGDGEVGGDVEAKPEDFGEIPQNTVGENLVQDQSGVYVNVPDINSLNVNNIENMMANSQEMPQMSGNVAIDIQNLQNQYPDQFNQVISNMGENNMYAGILSSITGNKKGEKIPQPDEWADIPNDQSPYSRFWAEPDSFRYFQNNSMEVKSYNSIYYAVGFLIIILAGIVLMFCSIGNSSKASSSQTASGLSMTIFISFLVVVLMLLFLLANQYFFPDIFLEYGIWIATGFHLLCVFLLMFFGIFYWAAIWFVFAIIALFFWFISRDEKDFNKTILGVLNKFVLSNSIFLLFIIAALVLMSFILVCALYTAWGAFGSGWIGLTQFYILITLWYSINVLSNCFYMMSGYLMAKQYFTPGSLTFGDVFIGFKKAFIYNIGIACKAALILPFTDWIRNIALTSPLSFSNDLVKTAFIFVMCMRALFFGVQSLFKRIIDYIDSKIGYHSRKALVYVGMFGIEWEEASRRYAEICSKRHANVVDQQYNGDLIWVYRTFNAEFLALILCIAFGPNAYGSGIGEGRGLFIGFALFSTIRSILRGAAESLFICFGEEPNSACNIDPELTEVLKKEFATGTQIASGNFDITSLIPPNLETPLNPTSPYYN